ncbi:DUF4153 domain-containing protein [Deinococcus aquaedulcis]|uniref:DUF4153 domain-containing protein n=1 Tax=Deinococcus aquaedulcis TaxID=2840455 RepID=UPI001C82885D|nr:DUF4173 domain-containing protein [Deinococcus aquaedulcis]
MTPAQTSSADDATPPPLAGPLTPAGWDAAPAHPRPALAARPLLLALGLGLAAHVLTWRAGPAGLNLALWLVLFLGASVWGLAGRGQTPSRAGVALLGVAALFGLSFTLWDAPPELAVLNTLALLGSLTLGAAFLRFPGLGRATPGLLLAALMTGGLRFAYGPLVLLERFPWARLRPKGDGGRQLGRVGVGLALAAPLLLVFGALLASADAGFAQALSGLWRPAQELDTLLSSGLGLMLWCAFVGGLTYPALMALRPTFFAPRDASGRLGLVEVGLPLGALALLFLAFAALQVPALLGGGLPDGQTYAGHIRRGFSELMTVAFLTLSVLLGAHGLSRPETRRSLPLRALNAAVLLPLLVILASAAQRWGLYTQAYGLSTIRVLGAAFLVWVTLTLGWLALCLWRDRAGRFAFPALLLGLATLLGTTALNPGALIAAHNLHRQTAAVTNDLRRTPQQVGVWDLLNLGAGAVPAIVANLDVLAPPCGPAANCVTPQTIIDDLHDRYDTPRDPRAWNLAYARAHALVQGLPPRSPFTR